MKTIAISVAGNTIVLSVNKDNVVIDVNLKNNFNRVTLWRVIEYLKMEGILSLDSGDPLHPHRFNNPLIC